MKFRHILLVIVVICLLVLLGAFWARRPDTQDNATPAITFIGIGSGSLASDLSLFQPQTSFAVTDRSLLGVVQYQGVPNGSTITADWFAPDDRSPPLGRSQVTVEQNAKIARFLFGNKQNWEASPYMLQVYIQPPKDAKDTAMRTLSGSTAFFIGLENDVIAQYRKELAEWKLEEAKKSSSSAAATSSVLPVPLGAASRSSTGAR